MNSQPIPDIAQRSCVRGPSAAIAEPVIGEYRTSRSGLRGTSALTGVGFQTSNDRSEEMCGWRRTIAGVLARSCRLLLVLGFPALLNAQLTYTTNNGAITITGYTGPGGEVVIPPSINGLPVTAIGDYAFYSNTALTGITIPEGIIYIGNDAFSHTSLASVTLPNSLVDIGYAAFSACWEMASVVMSDSIIWVSPAAFADCTNLTTVTFPPSLTEIGGNAFQGCWNLSGLFFEGNAPVFGHDAFGFFLNATVYYLPGTTGWTPTVEGLPTAPWGLPNPLILTLPPDFGVGTNGYGFVISWATNASVVVEACADLALPEWSPVGTNTLVEGWSYFSDPEWTNYANRFYRLRSP